MNPFKSSEPPLFRTEPSAPDFPLFDVQVNVNFGETCESFGHALSPSEYLRVMTQTGTRWACISPSQIEASAMANNRLLSWCKSDARHMLPLARLGGVSGQHLIDKVLGAACIRRPKNVKPLDLEPDLAEFSGVRLVPHVNGLPNRNMLAAINRDRLPVLVHTGTKSTPKWVEHALISQLEGPVILAHLGAYPLAPALLADAVEIARSKKNVYLDTSSAWLSEFIRYAAREVPHKLLFASHAPLAHPHVAWLQLQSAVYDDNVLENICWRQAYEIFQPSP